ncbi:hypothetical protein [Scleromatobacter humisilvae]|uniref:Uncharacterized protein n=1 Tax=Scleromatobacter humisilvae TaxID=2897159 RepID=A0A9X1YLG8_9BURK|nr:hypothetical protein [Scleromatobacter humisilvae]MCK9686557.1 hypothetical protein [Scleromatobacter humisilvae]
MQRRRLLALPALALTGLASGKSRPSYRFGILAQDGDGDWRLATETTRIPRRYKASGFRFGIEFTNWDRAPLEWYEVVRLPSGTKAATGNMSLAEPRVLRTKPQSSDQARITDDFWFDEGDPLGRHRLELVVNGVQVFAVDFEVVAA